MAVADFAIQFRFGNQSGNRVDDDQIHCIGFDQHLRNLQTFFPIRRLTHQQFVQVYTQSSGPRWIERMFGIHKCRNAGLLSAGDRM